MQIKEETAKDRHSEMCILRWTERPGEMEKLREMQTGKEGQREGQRDTKKSGKSSVKEIDICVRQNKRWQQGGEL